MQTFINLFNHFQNELSHYWDSSFSKWTLPLLRQFILKMNSPITETLLIKTILIIKILSNSHAGYNFKWTLPLLRQFIFKMNSPITETVHFQNELSHYWDSPFSKWTLPLLRRCLLKQFYLSRFCQIRTRGIILNSESALTSANPFLQRFYCISVNLYNYVPWIRLRLKFIRFFHHGVLVVKQ